MLREIVKIMKKQCSTPCSTVRQSASNEHANNTTSVTTSISKKIYTSISIIYNQYKYTYVIHRAFLLLRFIHTPILCSFCSSVRPTDTSNTRTTSNKNSRISKFTSSQQLYCELREFVQNYLLAFSRFSRFHDILTVKSMKI
jgi:hypothetical protein